MKISEEDKVLIKKFIQIRNRGYFCSGEQVTKVYNRVFEQNRPNTNCSSCLRSRISELEKALRQWEQQEAKEAEIKAQEALKEEQPGNASSLHSNSLEMSTPIKEEANEEPTEQKKRGRPKKNKEE